jgi:hypothetical protein
MVDNAEEVNSLVQGGRQITNTANKFNISCGSTYSIIKVIRHYKICARWMPKQLMDEQKQACMEMCMQFFQ